MWTPEHRRAADRSDLRYPSDLTDAEWTLVEPIIPPARHGGRKRSVNVARRVVPANRHHPWRRQSPAVLPDQADQADQAALARRVVLDCKSALLLHGRSTIAGANAHQTPPPSSYCVPGEQSFRGMEMAERPQMLLKIARRGSSN
jgi:hypothetical protein